MFKIFSKNKKKTRFEDNYNLVNLFSPSDVKLFGVPYILHDDVLSSKLIDDIEEFWPTLDKFSPEVPGMNILKMIDNNYKKLNANERDFWISFYQDVWLKLMTSISSSFSQIGLKVFDQSCMSDIRLDWPLTLMQADSAYVGHGVHTHFYTVPHWYFTVLFYVDKDDNSSQGTTLLSINSNADTIPNSYNSTDPEQLAFAALNWNNTSDPMSNVKIDEKPLKDISQKMNLDFKSNRLFAMLDGPLSFHSVEKAEQENNQRRVIRSHIKVHHPLFYNLHSSKLGCNFDPVLYMKVCAPNAVLSEDEKFYKSNYVIPFYEERIEAYNKSIENFFGNPKINERDINERDIFNNLSNNLPK